MENGAKYPRIADESIDRYLRRYGAVELSGVSGCGKSTIAARHASSSIDIADPSFTRIAVADPSYALDGELTRLIDEWQYAPDIWNAVYRKIGTQGVENGSWLLTRSFNPLRDRKAFKGGSRIAKVRMHPMTLLESGESSGFVKLEELFLGLLSPASVAPDINGIAKAICRGGWPSLVGLSAPDASKQLGRMLAQIIDEHVTLLGGDPDIARRLCNYIARNIGEPVNHRAMARDVFAISPGRNPTDAEQRSIAEHVSILSRLFLIDEIPGWVPESRETIRMRTKSRLYFADPSIAACILGLAPDTLLRDWSAFERSFRNLCMRDLDVYARTLEGSRAKPIRYYMDDSKLSVDAVIELVDGRWGAFRFAISDQEADDGARALLRMQKKLCRGAHSRTPLPSFMAILTATGERALRRPDGVFQIPIRALGV